MNGRSVEQNAISIDQKVNFSDYLKFSLTKYCVCLGKSSLRRKDMDI